MGMKKPQREAPPTPLPDRARAIRTRTRYASKAIPVFEPRMKEARALLLDLSDLVVDLADQLERVQRAAEGREHGE